MRWPPHDASSAVRPLVLPYSSPGAGCETAHTIGAICPDRRRATSPSRRVLETTEGLIVAEFRPFCKDSLEPVHKLCELIPACLTAGRVPPIVPVAGSK